MKKSATAVTALLSGGGFLWRKLIFPLGCKIDISIFPSQLCMDFSDGQTGLGMFEYISLLSNYCFKN